MKQLPPIEDAFRLLGITKQDLDMVLSHAPNWEVANAELKKLIRSRRKELALKLHPDRTGDDPDACERMKQVNDVADMLLDKIVVGPRPQPQPVRFIVVNTGWINTGGWGGWGGGTTSNTGF